MRPGRLYWYREYAAKSRAAKKPAYQDGPDIAEAMRLQIVEWLDAWSIKKEFMIMTISPGNSTAFEVYVPDVGVDTKSARFEYLGSTAEYATR